MQGLQKTCLRTVAVWIAAAWLAAPAAAQTPYSIPSRCEFNAGASAGDPSANGNSRVCLAQLTKAACEQFWFCWWRDTANQNALAEHTFQEFPGAVYQPYSSSQLNVLVYASAHGPNVVALLTANELLLVGMGGGRDEANYAKIAFQTSYPSFTAKHLKAMIYPNAYPESTWGGTYWRNIFPSSPPAPAYARAGFNDSQMRGYAVQPETWRRQAFAYGRHLTWGADALLGLGWAREYRAESQYYMPPYVQIAANTDILMDGVTVTLMPGDAVDAELMVWLPAQKIAIVPSMGKYFAGSASLFRPGPGIQQQLARLDMMIHDLDPELLVPLNGLPISGASAVFDALAAQHGALGYVRGETVRLINLGTPLDDIVNAVSLPPELANSPYSREFADRVPAAVRAVYHEYMGWFDGVPASLTTLPRIERARRMIALGGGENQVLNYAHGLLTEHTRAGAVMAVDVLGMLRLVYPSAKANALYVQALKMLAFSESSGPLRNYYLTLAQEVITGAAVPAAPLSPAP